MTLAQIKHYPRGTKTLPDTTVFNDRPAIGKGPGFRLNDWVDFMHELNPGDNEYRFVTAPHTGWVNAVWEEPGYPLAESLSMGGNLVDVIDQIGRFSRINGLPFSSPSFAEGMTYESHPAFIHKFSCITPGGGLRKPSSGLDVYYPVLSRGELWIETGRLDFTLTTEPPIPPMPADVGGAPAERRVAIRRTRALRFPRLKSIKNDVYEKGDRFSIDEIAGRYVHAPRGWVLAADTMRVKRRV